MSELVIEKVRESVEALRASLHEPTVGRIAPDLGTVLGEAKGLYWMFPDLLERLADQLTERSSLGGLRDDRGEGHDPVVTAAEAAIALRSAAETIRSVGREIEDGHNALSHLGDDPDL